MQKRHTKKLQSVCLLHDAKSMYPSTYWIRPMTTDEFEVYQAIKAEAEESVRLGSTPQEVGSKKGEQLRELLVRCIDHIDHCDPNGVWEEEEDHPGITLTNREQIAAYVKDNMALENAELVNACLGPEKLELLKKALRSSSKQTTPEEPSEKPSEDPTSTIADTAAVLETCTVTEPVGDVEEGQTSDLDVPSP